MLAKSAPHPPFGHLLPVHGEKGNSAFSDVVAFSLRTGKKEGCRQQPGRWESDRG